VRCGRSVADAPDDPVVFEAVGKVAERMVELLDGAESVQPEELLLQGADEALDAAVALGLADEGGAGGDPDGPELVLEGVGDELAAVVMPQRHARGDRDLVVALGGPDRLAHALDGLEARAPQCGAHAQALAGAVVDEDEDGGVALVGHAPGGVDGPHLVRTFGDDGALVDLRAADGRRPLAGKQSVGTHDAQHPSHRGADALLLAQAGPHLAVALADDGACGQDPADPGEQRLVVEGGARATLAGHRRRRTCAGLAPLDGGAGELPRPTDALDAVGLLRGG